jgi:2-methylisocitrate lyase-like PEP mutase family enzyme
MNNIDQAEKAKQFARMHQGPEILILPNAWDVGSALLFARLGFQAIATSSAGIAYSRGILDGERIARDEMLAVVRAIAGAVDLPVTTDLEGGYGREPEAVAETIRLAIKAGAVGANIEDSTKGDTRDTGKLLFDIELATQRYRAAKEAAKSSGISFVLNARVDSFLRLGTGREVAADSIRRGNAYREAGADCIFVPGVTDRETIALLAREIKAPINILTGPGIPSAEELGAMGVRRVSFGASLFRAAYSEAVRVAREMRERGLYTIDPKAMSNKMMNEAFAENTKTAAL